MANFYASKDWVIILPPDTPEVKKAAGDLSRYIGLLAGYTEGAAETMMGRSSPPGGVVQKLPALLNAGDPMPSDAVSTIILSRENSSSLRNGFRWKAGTDRIEIHGESGRGLCNGIYSFLGALGLSWPAPGQEILPSPQVTNLRVFALSTAVNIDSVGDSVCEPSNYEGNDPISAPWRRFIPAGKDDVKWALKRSEAFVAWAARRRYDALIFPLEDFSGRNTGRKLNELRKLAGEYDIVLEAGGPNLSLLVPRRFFLFRRDSFRMEGGRRRRDHHFCPTNPGTIQIIAKEGEKLFRAAAGSKIFHLWPDKGASAAWCSCSCCRAFTPAEQNRIGVNAAADVLSAVDLDASVTFLEKPGEGENVPLRNNLFRLEKLPEEKEFR